MKLRNSFFEIRGFDENMLSVGWSMVHRLKQ